jgi:transposase
MLGFEELYTNNANVSFYSKIFGELDLSGVCEFPRKSTEPTKYEGRKPISRHNIYRAFVVMKTQRFREVSQLLDYLENNIVITMLCGFEGGRIPGKDVFYDFLRDIPKAERDSVIIANTLNMHELGLVDFKDLVEDSMPIFANTKLNNPKSFSKNRFKKSQTPAGDSNCKLGVHSASNDSNNKDFEFFWGYKDHVLLDALYGLPIFNLTLTANTSDVKAGEILARQAEAHIGLKGNVRHLIADKAYDSNPFYEAIKEILGAKVIAPLRSNAKTQLFDGTVPVCEAGLTMHRCGRIYRDSGVRYKFTCPLRGSSDKPCPCNHPNSLKLSKNKGCIKYRLVKAANLRNCTNRDLPSFKRLYAKRSSIERYNSRFKFLDNEKASVRNLNSVSALVSISHVCLQLTAIVSAKDKNFDLIRSLAALKRSA